MKVEVISITDLPDGGAEISFDVDEEYKAHFMKSAGLKRWSNKRFEKFVIGLIEKNLKDYEDCKEDCKEDCEDKG